MAPARTPARAGLPRARGARAPAEPPGPASPRHDPLCYFPSHPRPTVSPMDLNFLDFEQPIAELEAKIDELRFVGDDSKVNISSEIGRLKSKSEALTRSIFSDLSAWQIAQLARHPMRPYTLDYLPLV